MGWKTSVLAFADGDVAAALRRAGTARADDTEALVGQLHPGCAVDRIDDGVFGEHLHPPDETAYAAVTDEVAVVCSPIFMTDEPSRLPEHVITLAGRGRMVLHAMHSVSDFFGYAVWQDGQLLRALSMAPDGGIGDNIGAPLDFERPFWAGEQSVRPTPGRPDERPYPLPFHPLELGERALESLLGFSFTDDADRDPAQLRLHGYRVTDLSEAGRARKAARDAAMKAAVKAMGRPRQFTMAADGTLVEIR